MLDSGVEFTSLGSNGIDCGYDLVRKHFFNFKVEYKNAHEKYTVEFHEYKHNMFVGKYYPTKFSREKHPNASFGFIGEPKYIKIKPKGKKYTIVREEDIVETKRYQLYRKICFRDVGIENFSLYENKSKSAILLINNNIKDKETYVTIITEMMKRNYSSLDL